MAYKMDPEFNFARDAYKAALLKCSAVRAYDLVREEQCAKTISSDAYNAAQLKCDAVQAYALIKEVERTRKIFKDVYMAPFNFRLDNAKAAHRVTTDQLKNPPNNDPIAAKDAFDASWYEWREADYERTDAYVKFDEVYE
jgi:hypothetical protein